MIVDDKFSIEKDPHCWLLKEKYTNKKGNESTKTTYHANIQQVSEVVLDRLCGDCDSLIEIIAMFDKVSEQISDYIKISSVK